MRYPSLIRKEMCRTEITVSVDQEGTGNYGVPLDPVVWTGMCNYQESAKTVLTETKKLVQVTGSVLIPGDIIPDMPTLSGGTAHILGHDRRIVLGVKARNPDGTVNYTRLELE